MPPFHDTDFVGMEGGEGETAAPSADGKKTASKLNVKIH